MVLIYTNALLCLFLGAFTSLHHLTELADNEMLKTIKHTFKMV